MKRRHAVVSAASVAFFLLTAAVLWLLMPPPRHGGWDQKGAQGLADFGPVPDFSLTERSGKPLTLRDLDGHVWVANFMYTSCKDTCPLQSAALAGFQAQWNPGQQVKFVSISVDPERDTPAVLSSYADRFGADPQRWFFLTGPKETIYQLAREGFRVSAAPAETTTGVDDNDFIHSARFVLVDGKARIRGYYPSNEPEALRQLGHDVRILLQEGSTHG